MPEHPQSLSMESMDLKLHQSARLYGGIIGGDHETTKPGIDGLQQQQQRHLQLQEEEDTKKQNYLQKLHAGEIVTVHRRHQQMDVQRHHQLLSTPSSFVTVESQVRQRKHIIN